MTSPSHKNHPTTAPHKATRCKGRSLWQQLLTGTLCLAMMGGTFQAFANDKEPLERLKQRSPRQRWRELRGEWVPAPELPGHKSRREAEPPLVPEFLPMQLSAPKDTVVPAAPAAVAEPATVPPPSHEPAVPAPEPQDVNPEVARDLFVRPGAKPAADPTAPIHHPGTVAEPPLGGTNLVGEARSTARPMPRDPDLPNWPFRESVTDVQPLAPLESVVERIPVPAEPQAVRVAELPRENGLTTPLTGDFQTQPVPLFPSTESAPQQPDETLRVAQQPAEVAPPNPEPAVPYNPSVEVPSPASEPASNERRMIRPLKSIREIKPFSSYAAATTSLSTPNTSTIHPREEVLQVQGQLERNSASTAVYWEASNATHNPLYFEDPGLERSGHTFSECVQPFVSLGRFGAQVIALPYSIALDPAWKQESNLGHHRPGECQTPRHMAIPLNAEAAGTAAAAYTGIIYLLP